jgi:hypothetical protein
MTNPKRWLDELPRSSQERELLLVGKAARPAEGTIDANWKAICTALGTTAAISGTFATSAAAHSAATSAATSAQAGASLAVSKAAGAGLLLVAAKSAAVGVGIGLAVMGAASVAERVGDRSAHPVTATKPTPATTARHSSTSALPAEPAPQFDRDREQPAASPSSSATSPARSRESGAALGPISNSPAAPAPVPASAPVSAEEKTASLARQARELAELKRLIDSGATTEALRRLNENVSAGTASLLSEERDALHVQALARAQRRSEARALARQFLVRYPHSPYFETMRQLLTEE